MSLYKDAHSNIFVIIFAYLVAFIAYCAAWCEVCLVAKVVMVNIPGILNIWQHVLAILVTACLILYNVTYILDVVRDAEDKRDAILFLALLTLSAIVSYFLVIYVDGAALFFVSTSVIVLCLIATKMYRHRKEE